MLPCRMRRLGVNDPSSAWLHARCCPGLTVEGHLTQSPTPRRVRRPNHPNLLLLEQDIFIFAFVLLFLGFWFLKAPRTEGTGGAIAIVPGVHLMKCWRPEAGTIL